MSNDAEALARALVRSLYAAGVRHVVLCPGSRSAPLAYALADATRSLFLRLDVRVDERSAGFVALGIAKARGIAAVVTTSGTAVANLHPAVLEASHAGVGLVVVSADRPAELRGTGANQTTRQPGIFGGSTRFDADLPPDTPEASVRGQVARALAAARGTITRDPGPVHLNVQFREPLGPPPHRELSGAERSRNEGDASTITSIDVVPTGPAPTVRLDPELRTLIVAGDGAGSEVAEIAERAGIPLLAEPSSGARTPHAIRFYRDLLGTDLPDGVERVIVAGHPTLSRPVTQLLARTDIEIVVVSPTARWTDVAATASRVVSAVEIDGQGDAEWLQRWRDADEQLAERAPLTAHERVAETIWRAGGNLVLGSSSTIRAFDVAPGTVSPCVFANRGLAGIDGTVSTATGIVRGLGEPVRAVIGDLTFLHDATALVRGVHESDVDLQVIVLDDSGGSIFGTLEYGSSPGAEFERIFATPQQIDVTGLARSLGAEAIGVTPDDLADAIARPIAGRSVIHVRLDRSGMADTLRQRRELAVHPD